MRAHALVAAALALTSAAAGQEPRKPLFITVDIDRGETQEVALSNGARVRVKLVDVSETRDSLRSALRQARVTVEIDGQPVTIVSANYRLPVSAGKVQIDCPATKGLYPNRDNFEDSWGLEKDARLRLWPAGSPWAEPGTLVYPALQPWFIGSTQTGNEPAYVDGGDFPAPKRQIYYHSGFDMGGCEGLIEVVAAASGLVVSAGGETLPEYPDLPYYTQKPADGVYIIDDHGWIYRYVHLKSIDPAIRPGRRVPMGQKLGVLGKEGGSGGWSHLHFDIKARQPSGKWGVLDSYAFLWEVNVSQKKPQLIAVARPHHLAAAGETVTLDGSRSWSASGKIAKYEWTFCDGTRAEGATVERAYPRPGSYSEVLKVTDSEGRVEYDFAIVQVIDKAAEMLPPTIHASFAPTVDIHPGDPITFKVRSFRAERGDETWDFGDGSPRVNVHSDGNVDSLAPNGYAETVHRFADSGRYIVRVEGKGAGGTTATGHLQVRVEARAEAPEKKAGALHGWLDRKLLPESEAESMMRRFVDVHLAPLPLPATREEWMSRRDALRKEVLAAVGIDDLVPPRWDLKARTQGTLARDGYRIEKLTFESYPGMAIPALLYLPEEVTGRVPGIVSISGHTPASKAADYVQERNVNLALRGCVVLCYDYYGHGDRKTGDNPSRPTGGNAHDIRTFSFTRRSATAIEALDAIRAIDVLVARADVDPERIGFTGESGGSNSTYWAAALDARVRLAVPVSSVSTFDYWIRTDVNWDWHQRPPGIRRIADIGTLLALHAPSPLAIVSSKRGTDDEEFPLDEAERSFRWAKGVYDLLGAEDGAAIHHESVTAHGYQEDKREVLYRAVERWLRPPRPRDGKELPAKVESAEDLRCVLPADNLTVRDVYAQWLALLPRSRPDDTDAGLRSFLRERLGLPAELPPVRAEKVGAEEKDGDAAEFWLIEPEPGIRLPAVLLREKGAAGAVVIVPGRDAAAVEQGLRAGARVLAFDPRSTGEIKAGGRRLDNWGWFSGRPLVGQWALDYVQIARFARERLSAAEVTIDARGRFGWAGLLAGAAHPEVIPSGAATVPVESLHDLIRRGGDTVQADVPGLLERIDVPQIRRLWPKGDVKVARE